jgi:hypothetical protein
MFDLLSFWRKKTVEEVTQVAAGDAALKAQFPNIDPAKLRAIIDTVFEVALAATTTRPIIHIMLGAAQTIVDSLLPKVAANLTAKGIRV